jgi:hypothetical protein
VYNVVEGEDRSLLAARELMLTGLVKLLAVSAVRENLVVATTSSLLKRESVLALLTAVHAMLLAKLSESTDSSITGLSARLKSVTAHRCGLAINRNNTEATHSVCLTFTTMHGGGGLIGTSREAIDQTFQLANITLKTCVCISAHYNNNRYFF